MASVSKETLLAKAKELGLELTEENTVPEIKAAIADATDQVPAAPAAPAPAAEPKPAAAPAKKRSWKIKTPVENFTGITRGVAFIEGEGTTDNAWYAQRCAEAGYEVTEE